MRKGPLLQVSGQGPVDALIQRAGGASFDDVIMLFVYLTKPKDCSIMNDAYAAFMDEHVKGDVLPDRTTVFTGLPRGEMIVEIDALAVIEQ